MKRELKIKKSFRFFFFRTRQLCLIYYVHLSRTNDPHDRQEKLPLHRERGVKTKKDTHTKGGKKTKEKKNNHDVKKSNDLVSHVM